jgi:hypothetical protein
MTKREILKEQHRKGYISLNEYVQELEKLNWNDFKK